MTREPYESKAHIRKKRLLTIGGAIMLAIGFIGAIHFGSILINESAHQEIYPTNQRPVPIFFGLIISPLYAEIAFVIIGVVGFSLAVHGVAMYKKVSSNSDYFNITNIIIFVDFVVIFVVFYFLLSTESTSKWFEKTMNINRGPSAYFPLHFITTLMAVLIYSGIIYMIYRIQTAGENKFNDYKDDNLLFSKAENDKREDIIANVTRIYKGNTKEENDKKVKKEFERWLKERFHVKEKDESLPVIGLDAGAAAGLAALIVSFAVAFLANFVQIPILDYEVELPADSNDNQYQIKINNYGNAPAKHVLLNLEQSRVNFTGFIINPYLANHVTEEHNTTLGSGKGFIDIEDIPAFSRTDIIAEMDASSVKDRNNSKLTVNVRSDESVGKVNTMVLGVYYVPILIVALVVPILFWIGTIPRDEKNAFRAVLLLFEGVVVGAVFVSFYYRA